MNMHTERTELLSTNLMNLGQNRSSTTTTTTTLISTEDKDSIYTFSDNCNSDIDETDTIDHERFTQKYGALANAGAATTTTTTANKLSSIEPNVSSTPYLTDRNLNNTRNSQLKETIRTYQKKKPSATASFSSKNDQKKLITPSTMTSADFNTLSCLSLPSPSSIHLSPPSDDSNYQLLKCNGKLTSGKYFWFC